MRPIDENQVREWYYHFKDDHMPVEVRIVYLDKQEPRAMHRQFTDSEAIIRYLESLPDRPHHCYWSLNDISDEWPKSKSINESAISRRRWILVDFDPERPSHTSSTDSEKESARERMVVVRSYLESKGFPTPCVTDSGNGYHLYYKLDADNNKENTDIVSKFLNGLDAKFGDDAVHIDPVNTDPNRISKIPGTWAVKGESTEDRPHRRSEILEIPDDIEIVEMSLLQAVAVECGQAVHDRSQDEAQGEGRQATDQVSGRKTPDEFDQMMTEADVRKYVDALDDYYKDGGSVEFHDRDWLTLGYAFASMGPSGKEYFHKVFAHHPYYNHDFAEQEYNRLNPRYLSVGDHQLSEISIRTFFNWCHNNGIRPEGYGDGPTEFPFDVFPTEVQDLIDKAHASRLKFPKVYTSCGVLCAVSCAIGNALAVEFTREHVENAVLYMALVGGKGKNKSHPLSMTMRPLQDMDDEDYHQYRVEYARYMEDQDRPKKERMGLPEPTRKRRIVGDITAEALAMVMQENPRGVLLLNDELIGWIKAQNQYRSGNGADGEMWLSLWSGKSHDVTRKTSGDARITKPFVSVCGTIQPTIIPTLAQGREANGFLDRILFAWPQDTRIEPFSEDDPEMDDEVLETWKRLIRGIVGLPYDGNEPRRVRLSVEASRMYIRWQRAEAVKCNLLDEQRIRMTDDVDYNGIHAKMESYCLRLALILEVLSSECAGGLAGRFSAIEISSESMDGAIRLCKYFTAQALAIHGILNASEVDRLDERHKRVYLALPDEFTTAQGLEVAKRYGMPERTFKRFLKSSTYFKKERQGCYIKTQY